MGTRTSTRSAVEAKAELLQFDFDHPEDTGPRPRLNRVKPGSVKEAIIRWLEQQL